MSPPSQSRYLQYLPAIYQDDPFAEQFLLPFEVVFTGFENLLSEIDRYFDPAETDSDFLPWLATWVALVLDEEWDEQRRRQLIDEAVELYRWRGTVKGLKRYLEIYTGLAPEIREWRWPGGMQIGVASQLGGFDGGAPAFMQILDFDREAAGEHDYYVVDTVAGAGHPELPPGSPWRLYYRADRIQQVEIHGDAVHLWRFVNGGTTTQIHQPATISRRDGLAANHFHLTTDLGSVDYRGDTFLIGEIERPYRFIVDVRVPLAEVENVKFDKVRAIVELEKPAHTLYYLKLTPVVSQLTLQSMQIGLRSTIGLDTTAG